MNGCVGAGVRGACTGGASVRARVCASMRPSMHVCVRTDDHLLDTDLLGLALRLRGPVVTIFALPAEQHIDLGTHF